MSTISRKPGSFGSKAAFLAGSDRSGSESHGVLRQPVAGTPRMRAWGEGGGVWAAIWSVLRQWQARVETRRHVRMLDDRMLKDIGMTPADVNHEIAKPFWRP